METPNHFKTHHQLARYLFPTEILTVTCTDTELETFKVQFWKEKNTNLIGNGTTYETFASSVTTLRRRMPFTRKKSLSGMPRLSTPIGVRGGEGVPQGRAAFDKQPHSPLYIFTTRMIHVFILPGLYDGSLDLFHR
ncbi:hypothetical protein EVAR_26103_1 [Eumeta japonica]|uniref:Uncharacterized protein n=1 Tax=Eumeta variegata TaxID=151549 RepID=A0A4C1WZK5_EUMVA|nr:hypothetical protein EVAR_26103_1 [Eumeta japonica]